MQIIIHRMEGGYSQSHIEQYQQLPELTSCACENAYSHFSIWTDYHVIYEGSTPKKGKICRRKPAGACTMKGGKRGAALNMMPLS